MGTKYPDIWQRLAAPFPPEQLRSKSKKGRDGGSMQIRYVDAQHVQQRLDEVVGPENWEITLTAWGTDLIATLTIHLPDGSTVSKSDVGGRPKMNDQADEAKATASHALRRCAVLFGIGRYLYAKDSAGRAGQAPPAPAPREEAHDRDRREAREKVRHEWGTADHGEAARRHDREDDDAPRTGGALYARLKDLDAERGHGLLQWVDQWARRDGLPPRMKDWNASQVRGGWSQARARMEALEESDRFQGSLAN